MKRFLKNNIQRIRAALLLGLATTLILQATVLAERCYEIRDSVLRLHILANSDSSQDQLLKLKVRDKLLTQGGELLQGAKTKDEAILITQSCLEKLTHIARETVAENGYDYAIDCSIEQAYFDTRVYETITLPAGNYTALRVIIGEGSGQNWWCVMFPALCIPAAAEVTDDRDALSEVLTPGQTDLVENGTKYEIKFKAVEWFQSAVNRWNEWF